MYPAAKGPITAASGKRSLGKKIYFHLQANHISPKDVPEKKVAVSYVLGVTVVQCRSNFG